MSSVAELLMKGLNPTEIARKTSIPRKDVVKLIEDWKEWAVHDQDIMERARETLAIVDEHFGLLIRTAWEIIDQADNEKNLVVKVQAVKALQSLEADRWKMFHDAGMDDQGMLLAEMRDTQEKQEKLKEILRDVSRDCPNCKIEIRKRLQEMNKAETEVIQVDAEAVDAEIVDG